MCVDTSSPCALRISDEPCGEGGCDLGGAGHPFAVRLPAFAKRLICEEESFGHLECLRPGGLSQDNQRRGSRSTTPGVRARHAVVGDGWTALLEPSFTSRRYSANVAKPRSTAIWRPSRSREIAASIIESVEFVATSARRRQRCVRPGIKREARGASDERDRICRPTRQQIGVYRQQVRLDLKRTRDLIQQNVHRGCGVQAVPNRQRRESEQPSRA